ncbi:MAG TPA: FecR domain-containing protein [Polyangiaceae bacterium]|jgi:hypothetical protein|nr:FecR domain-containing protein [Polyangiaceae bacterium]
MERELSTLGRAVAQRQDEAEAPFDFEEGRDRLLASVAGARKKHGWARVAWAAAAVPLVIALALGVTRIKPRATGFHVDGAEGRIGTWVAAPADHRLHLAFDDGSVVGVEKNARVRVTRAEGDSATVIVERGTVHVAVVHRDDTHFRFDVGPFVVLVTGTKFDVSFEPESERLSLVMKEGTVVVSGGGLGSSRIVRGGEELVLGPPSSQPPPAASSTVRSAGTPLPALNAPEQLTKSAPPLEPPASKPQAMETSREAELPQQLRELARAGQYGAALELVERARFDALCALGSAADLVMLGDVARLAGDFGKAARAYGAVRARFSGAIAAQAAFLLGRLAFDRNDFGEAARFFELSLREAPAGPFAREAAGRRVEALDRAGDRGGARGAARRYLELYPGGPHSHFAETLLARD